MSAARFPGSAYGPDIEPLTAEAPVLSSELVASFRLSGVVVSEAPDEDEEVSAGLIWTLQDGARFADIPSAWVSRAMRLLQQGGALALLANDEAAEQSIRDGLLDRLQLIDLPATGMSRA